MIEAYKLRKTVEIPEGVEVNLVDKVVHVKKGSLEVKRELYFPTVEIKKEGNEIVLEPKRFTKKEIGQMLIQSGLENIEFRKENPFWCAVGFRVA